MCICDKYREVKTQTISNHLIQRSPYAPFSYSLRGVGQYRVMLSVDDPVQWLTSMPMFPISGGLWSCILPLFPLKSVIPKGGKPPLPLPPRPPPMPPPPPPPPPPLPRPP